MPMDADYNALREMFLAAIEEAQTETKLTGTAHSVVELPGELVAVPTDIALHPLVTITPGDNRSAREVAEDWYKRNRRASGP